MKFQVEMEKSFPSAPHFYPFFSDEEEEKLTRLFYNYINLGQFELARATLFQISKISPEKAPKLLENLLVSGIPLERYLFVQGFMEIEFLQEESLHLLISFGYASRN
jgi:hypothetical protein